MNADQLINRAKEAADKLYHDGLSLEKLNFHRGFLESTIRELVIYLDNANEEIKTLQAEIKELRND
jgi:hypothetical protein